MVDADCDKKSMFNVECRSLRLITQLTVIVTIMTMRTSRYVFRDQ